MTAKLNGKDIKLEGWNIFQVAVAFKQTQIVRYLIANRKMSIKHCCRDPKISSNEAINPEEKSYDETFCVLLTINNRDHDTLKLLW